MPHPSTNPTAAHARILAAAYALCAILSPTACAAPPGTKPMSTQPSPSIAKIDAPIALWHGTAPGDTENIGAETNTPDGEPGHRIQRVSNVSAPTITVYHPAKPAGTGAAVVVCPGGGYYILAMNLEGTEVCERLNAMGITAILLKYRVPVRQNRERYAAPLQDAQRAVGIVRAHAKQWGVNSARVGILGFSAGGHLSATLSNASDARTYPAVDDADKQPCRPDFTVLIYPAYLTPEGVQTGLAPEIAVSTHTPPAFIALPTVIDCFRASHIHNA